MRKLFRGRCHGVDRSGTTTSGSDVVAAVRGEKSRGPWKPGEVANTYIRHHLNGNLERLASPLGRGRTKLRRSGIMRPCAGRRHQEPLPIRADAETDTAGLTHPFTVTNLFEGDNTVIAMARDDDGLVGMSAPLRINATAKPQ
jgi:hypothetical protein